MAWIESHTVLLRHRKLLQLADDLRLKPVHTMGHLHALWHSALEQQENGVLVSWPDEMIALASAYSGAVPQYVSLLQKHGWIDDDRKLHDWWDYAGAYLRGKYKRNPEKWMKIKALYDVPVTYGLRNPTPTIPTIPTNLPNLPYLPMVADGIGRKKSDNQILIEHFAAIRGVSITNQHTQKKFFQEHGKAASAILAMSEKDLGLAKTAVSEIASYLDRLVAGGKISEWRNLRAIENNYIAWRQEYDKAKNSGPVPKSEQGPEFASKEQEF